MLGQFTRQDQSNGRLDFSGRHGRLLVVSGQLGGFSRDLFEHVVDEGVMMLIALEEMPVSGALASRPCRCRSCRFPDLLGGFLALPLTVFAGFLPAIFVCM